VADPADKLDVLVDRININEILQCVLLEKPRGEARSEAASMGATRGRFNVIAALRKANALPARRAAAAASRSLEGQSYRIPPAATPSIALCDQER